MKRLNKRTRLSIGASVAAAVVTCGGVVSAAAWSDSPTVSATAQTTELLAPTGVTAVRVGPGKITVSWDPVSDAGCSGGLAVSDIDLVTGVVAVERTIVTRLYGVLVSAHPEPVTASTYTMSGLTEGATYTVQVGTQCGYGSTLWTLAGSTTVSVAA